MEKKLYPFKFIPVASKRPWGGDALVKVMGKNFVECDEEGNEVKLGADVKIGESWELADMGIEDSVVADGWLAGNTISELMETYLERIVGEKVYNYYGRQFPLLIKFLDINDRLSVQVHPDDEVAAERYDSLGKAEIWYVMDAKPGAKIFAGFNKEMSAQELYDRCKNGTVEEVMNVITPRKGDSLLITPGTVHAADGGILIAEIQESSDMTFRLYDWGREFNPATARPLHLEEAIDIIDYRKFDDSLFRKGPLWEKECHCHDDECHCHEDKVAETLAERPEFCATKINLTDPLHIYTEQFESFIVYICVEGAASIQVPSKNAKGEDCMENYEFAKGETILVPAEMPDFFLVPRDRSTILLEAVCRSEEGPDAYIDPETDAFLDGEDYEGLESEEEASASSGSSPLNFFS
ncbi:MAG: class I mannose-6-phosphate isomerase [Bacteroidales bacterium]|nr:class I mannose-6-phosphate isomerase [Bacteroidales bacterium]MBQ8854619.1 class I mannose-6-phosphate isomerase [Bacteroidales bacterium]MBQ9722287.1 class I mannose-6-phosphate isomerase [Bacteroidales bacterium]